MHRIVREVSVVVVALAAALIAAGFAQPSPGLAWQTPVEVVTGRGERGAWRQNDSHYDYVDDATVAFLPGGGLALAWVDQRRKEVLVQRMNAEDGKPAGAAVDVSRSPATFSWQPRIAAYPGQAGQAARVYVLWQEIIFSGGSHGGDILLARSSDGGAQFEAPLNLSRSRGGDGKGRLDRTTWSNGSHDLAVAPNGDVLAAWTEYDGALWFTRSRDGGASFAAPRPLAGTDARPARAPALAAGPGGEVWLAWTVGEDPGADIHVARSGDGGASFGPAQRVGAGPGHADAPRLAVGGDGSVHLVYAQAPSGPGGRYEVRYARSTGGAAGFGAPRTISGAAGTGSAAYPGLAGDGRRGLAVIWEVLRPGAARPHALGIAVSSDGGAHFSTPANVPGSAAERVAANGSHQGLLGRKLAVDASGRIAIVNSSMAPGEGSRIRLMRGSMR